MAAQPPPLFQVRPQNSKEESGLGTIQAENGASRCLSRLQTPSRIGIETRAQSRYLLRRWGLCPADKSKRAQEVHQHLPEPLNAKQEKLHDEPGPIYQSRPLQGPLAQDTTRTRPCFAKPRRPSRDRGNTPTSRPKRSRQPAPLLGPLGPIPERDDPQPDPADREPPRLGLATGAFRTTRSASARNPDLSPRTGLTVESGGHARAL